MYSLWAKHIGTYNYNGSVIQLVGSRTRQEDVEASGSVKELKYTEDPSALYSAKDSLPAILCYLCWREVDFHIRVIDRRSLLSQIIKCLIPWRHEAARQTTVSSYFM